MANTWQGGLSSWLGPSFDALPADDLSYRIRNADKLLTYSVHLPNGQELSLPITIAVGGKRHGLGFLVPLKDLDGAPLARPALIQARYAWSPEKNSLLLAPGCSALKPVSTESALGLVLSPTFESRCLSCHGQPNTAGTGKDGGVHCESCHGTGFRHIATVGAGSGHASSNLEIINPKRLSNEASIEICAQCHVGLTRFSDPSADDLLVANQVRAIKSSECWLQSGKAFSCTTCHDPHSDTSPTDNRAVKACLGCHAQQSPSHASVCRVNASTGCIGCHMPSVEMGPLHLVDHLIRVHPERAQSRLSPAVKSQVQPISEYLRLIATTTPEVAATALDRIAKETFYNVARDLSIDHTAAIGGYLGRKTLTDLDPALLSQAAHLGYGETSPPLRSGERWVILQRLPRDFRFDAERLQMQAEDLATRGEAAAAIQKAQEALMIYPQFLRAISFIGVTFAQSGNPRKAAEVLTTALRLYPDDANTRFQLASTLSLLNNQPAAIQEYQRVIALEPDFAAAYANLGKLFYSTGDLESAIKTFRAGLKIDPLSAELYDGLAQALVRAGDTFDGAQAKDLAGKLAIQR